MEKSLLNCCEKFYVIINDIIKKMVQINTNFLEVLKESFEIFEAKAMLQGFSTSEIQLSKYALVALIDELISHYYPNTSHSWPTRSLQLCFYQTNVAGNQFFENLDELLLDENKNRSVLEIYYFCLQLNFQGQHSSQDQIILDYRRRLKNYFGAEIKTALLSDSREQSIPIWLLLSVILFLFLIIYAVFVVFINEEVFVMATDLNTYAEQLVDV